MVCAVRDAIRRVELERAWLWRSHRLRVLEIGGDRGLQAKMLHDWGNRVTCIDVRIPEAKLEFPIVIYDGCNLPFSDRAFDVVYSSNVLEHVPTRALPRLLAETARVLRVGGTAIHILPSPVWRLATMIAHYAWVMLYMFGVRSKADASTEAAARPAGRMRRLARLMYRASVPPPHGVYANAAAEMYFFSARRWRRVFETAGWLVESVRPVGVFYSGHKVTRLSVRARQRLAPLLGSSCSVFMLRRRA